jgi:hypothetical protein
MDTSETDDASRDNESTAAESGFGPEDWLFPTLESAYARLIPRDQPETQTRAAATEPSASTATFASRFRSGEGESFLATAARDLWVDRLAKYKRRKALRAREKSAWAETAPVGPVAFGQKHWAPLGPSVVVNGQALGSPSVAGRVSGIAVALGGQVVYAASANGGVFRSVDGGMSWRSMMDAFDVDPTNFASTSLACGAVGVDPNDPNRVYVGTGEGDTDAVFRRPGTRIVRALPAYRGIGPIRSEDGGPRGLGNRRPPTHRILPASRFLRSRSIPPTERTSSAQRPGDCISASSRLVAGRSGYCGAQGCILAS